MRTRLYDGRTQRAEDNDGEVVAAGGGGRRFGDLLRAHRIRAGLTQRRLADLSTISARAIRDLEAGRAQGRAQTVALLADGLGLTGLLRAAFLDAARGDHAADIASNVVDGVPPAATDRLIGRDAELRSLFDALDAGHRLIAICGLGGAGKTRLTLELANHLHHRRRWPVLWVAGGPGGTPGSGGPLAHELHHLLTDPGRGAITRFRRRLGGHDAVAVVDGASDLPAAADTADELLRACLHLKLVVTSRAPLPSSAAYTFVTGPLATPTEERLPASLEQLAGVPAVRFLLDRLAETRPGWTLTRADAPAVITLCRRLDGLPVALRLAAHQAVVRELAELADAPVTSFLRTAMPAPADSRARTLGQLVAASCRLLGEAERTSLHTLATLAPPWTVPEAADALRRPVTEVVDALVVFNRVGLLHRYRGGSTPQFALLHLVRAHLTASDGAPSAGPAAPRAERGWRPGHHRVHLRSV